MKNDYICHSGVKGMKWGVRKEYDKNQMVKDTRLLSNGVYSRHSAKRLAKKTQKRMTSKNETHSKALSTVIRRDALKRVSTTTIAGAYILSPRFRGFTNSAIKKVGGASLQGAIRANEALRSAAPKVGRVADSVRKAVDPNMIKVNPVSFSRAASKRGGRLLPM